MKKKPRIVKKVLEYALDDQNDRQNDNTTGELFPKDPIGTAPLKTFKTEETPTQNVDRNAIDEVKSSIGFDNKSAKDLVQSFSTQLDSGLRSIDAFDGNLSRKDVKAAEVQKHYDNVAQKVKDAILNYSTEEVELLEQDMSKVANTLKVLGGYLVNGAQHAANSITAGLVKRPLSGWLQYAERIMRVLEDEEAISDDMKFSPDDLAASMIDLGEE